MIRMIAPRACFMAMVLLCLALIAAGPVRGTYARYVSEAQGTDSARVAKFNVVVTQQPDALSVDGAADGPSATCQIEVTNDSEVATECSLTIGFADRETGESVNLQDGLALALSNGSDAVALSKSDAGAGVYVSDPIVISMGDMKRLELTISGGNHGSIVETQRLKMNVTTEVVQKG